MDRPGRADPGEEAGLELRRVQGREHPIERVVRGDAVAEVEEGAEPVGPRFPKRGNLVPTLGAADHRTDGDGQDIHQRMQLGALDPRVGERGEVTQQGTVGRWRHLARSSV